MPERIYKLQPNRTIQLRGFSDLGAAAALHCATANSFKVSGIFRDPADFCVLTLYDSDNFYEHPSLKYLPDTNFAGLTLSFDVHYSGLRNLDSPRYANIDWPFLDVIRGGTDSATARVDLLKEDATPVSGTWTAASAQFTVVDQGLRQWDRLTLWYLNQAFDFVVPQVETGYYFEHAGGGTIHSITVAGTTYSYVEQEGDLDITIAQRLLEALAGASHYVTATRVMNQVNLRATPGDGGKFQTSASSRSDGDTLSNVSSASIAADLAARCNEIFRSATGADIGLIARADGEHLTFIADQPGVDGNALSMYAVWNTPRLTTAQQFVQFSGGCSDAVWHVDIDFSACGIPDIRKMWLTFAPPVSCSKPFEPTEWEATFTNWTLSGPEAVRQLQVAGPGSLRIEDSSSACSYTGKWDIEAGFFSRGYAKVAKQAGSTLAIQYESALTHQLWVGTSLKADRGCATVSVDGAPEIPFSTVLKTNDDPDVITRRQIPGAFRPGRHTLLFETVDANPFYFDFLDIVVPSDVPDNLPARTNISPALDYSTDHTYKLPPARIMWMFDKLGFAGPVNEYIGVFWWNQRTRRDAFIPQARITFTGMFANDDQVWLNISETKIGKSVFSNDTNATIAQHFACYVNATFIGLWATVEGNTVTLTCHSPTKDFQFDLSGWVTAKPGSTGSVEIAGALKSDPADIRPGDWYVDPVQTPALNRGARDWHADFYAECNARNREVVTAASMELVLPSDELPALYHNGDQVRTSVGYGSDLWSAQCAFNSSMLAYQKKVFDCIAGMMTAAGVVPNLQFGEYCWWYFPSAVDGSMAFYDLETKRAAEKALGSLAVFTGPDDDPGINAGADATFLRNRLRDYVAALITDLRGKYPGAKFEVLFPYDVNYPHPAGVENPPGNKVGGRLLRFINFPAEWEHKETSGFDRIKMEGLNWGAVARNLDLVRDVLEFPLQMGWPLDSIRYMLPIFNGGCPWLREYRLAKGLGIPVINLWAFDHVCIFGLKVKEPARPARAVRF